MDKKEELQTKLDHVEEKLADLKARWPYHSVQPKLVAEREDLEEEREQLLRMLKNMPNGIMSSPE